jgi:hypothetical protein
LKILGFAHVSICLSIQQKNLFDLFFSQQISYEIIANNVIKHNFMEFRDKLHHISLEVPGFELCLYESTSLISHSELHSSLKPFSFINANHFHIESLLDQHLHSFLKKYGRLIDEKANIKLISYPAMKNLSFGKQNSKTNYFKTNGFLDSPGIVSVAFYTNSSLCKEECERERITYQEPFRVDFENRFFEVQLLKIGGANVELISRPRSN